MLTMLNVLESLYWGSDIFLSLDLL